MQFARSLISTLDSSIAEIAHMVGYEDESNFFRNFKTRYGMSPLQYFKCQIKLEILAAHQ